MTDIAPIDQNAVKGLIALDDTTSAPIAVQAKTTTGALYVHLDSSDVSIAGGTEYSDGDVNADPTGTVAMGTDGSNIFALHTDASGDLQVDILNASLAVTGTFWQATQPVSGTFWQATQPVSGTFWQATQPVSMATLPDTAATDLALQTADLDTIAGDTTSIQTAVELIDDTVYIDDADWTDSTSKHALVGGLYQSVPQTVTDGDVAPFNITANGALHISDAGGSLTVDASNLDIRDLTSTDVVTVTGGAGQTADVKITLDSEVVPVTGTFWQATQPVSIAATVTVDASGVTVPVSNAGLTELAAAINASSQMDVNLAASAITLPVSLASVPSHAVTNAGTFAVQDATAQASLSVLDDWDETNRAAVNTIAGQVGVQGASGTVTALTQRVVLATDVALPAGTAALGKLLPPDIDVTTHTNYAKKYYTNAGAVTDGIVWSPGAGKRWHVVSLYVQTSADATVTFEDDLAAGDSAVLKGEFKAGSGVTIPFDAMYPLASGEDAADLLVTTSAGNIYITCVGYEI